MTDPIQNPYHRLANTWFYSEDFVRFLTTKIIEYLRLGRSDTFVALGSGSAIYSQAILKQIQLYHPILCVDCFDQMISTDSLSEEIRCVRMNAIAFSAKPGRYDKILIEELIDRIEDKVLLFSNLWQKLTNEGILLLLLLPPTINYPLFSKALKRYEQEQSDYEAIANLLRQVGFEVAVYFVEYPLAIPKSKYYKMVENRYISLLDQFSDYELQEGIEEIEENYPNKSVFEFTDCCIFIKAVKPYS